MLPKSDPLAAVAALESRRALTAKLAELRKSGLDRREWSALPPDLQKAFLDADIPIRDATPAQIVAEWAAKGKRCYTECECDMVIQPGGPGTAGALFKEIWGQGVREAIDAEIRLAKAEGRIIPNGTGKNYVSPLNPPPEVKAALREKLSFIMLDNGLAAHGKRFFDAFKAGPDAQIVTPGDVKRLAESADPADREAAVVAVQRLGTAGLEAPETVTALQSIAARDANPSVRSRAYAALAAMNAPAEPAADTKGAANG